MKAYIHTGSGVWIGSAVIVIAKSRTDAEKIIRKELDEIGLKNEALKIYSEEIKPGNLIYSVNGDY